jgi:heme/copper-type cytochrome/quinol oxidase subunit 4
MRTLFSERDSRRNAIVWAVLVVATLISWSVGIDHGINYRLAIVVVLLVTFAKVYLVGMNFMELREAPLPLRLVFSGLCAVMCTVLVVMYLAAG